MNVFIAAICKSSPRVITAQKITGRLILEILEKHKVNSAFMAPVYIAQIAEESAKKSYDLSSWYLLQTGGSSLPDTTQQAFKSFYPEILIMAGYGMTEVGGGITFIMASTNKLKSVGRLLPGVTIKVKNY